MNKIGNSINVKYKRLFFIGILLLAVFLIFTILKQADRPSFEPYPSRKYIGDALCIETAWNESTSLAFTLRNCGDAEITPENFTGTTYYIDDVKTVCTPDNINETFNTQEIRTIRCPTGSYGVCTEVGCPSKVIQVKTAYGRKDTAIYRYHHG